MRERAKWERINCPTCDATGTLNDRKCHVCPTCVDCSEPAPISFVLLDERGGVHSDSVCSYCHQDRMAESRAA